MYSPPGPEQRFVTLAAAANPSADGGGAPRSGTDGKDAGKP